MLRGRESCSGKFSEESENADCDAAKNIIAGKGPDEHVRMSLCKLHPDQALAIRKHCTASQNDSRHFIIMSNYYL